MATNFENQTGPLDEFCQTSDNSEFSPLTSAKHLKRELTSEKTRHTKLNTKINQHIANFGSKRELAVHRASLADQLEDCIATHERYVRAPDFKTEEDADPNVWIKRCEAITMEVYEQIDKYIRTPWSSVHSSVVDEATLNNTLRGQPVNNDLIVGSSVSKSRGQVPNSNTIMNEIQQRLCQEIQLKRNVEEQLTKGTATMMQMTIDSAKLSSEIERNAELQRKIQQQAEQMAKDKRNTEQVELQYRTLVENEKRETNEKYEKAMKSVETRIKQLEELSRPQIETERSKKTDATGHGTIQKTRVEFSDRNTEVTAEEPKETDDNVNKEFWLSYGLTRRPIPVFSRNKPGDVNRNSNPGQFYSSSFGGFRLHHDEETSQITEATKGPSEWGQGFQHQMPLNQSEQWTEQGPSLFRTAPPSYGAANEPIHPFIRIAERVSTLDKFKSSVGWLRRFARNYSSNKKHKTKPSFLSVPELRTAMTFGFCIDQQHYFARELVFLRKRRPLPADSKLVHQNPFLDGSSVMRVGGRLDRSAFNEDIKHPIILHHESQLARLVIREPHPSWTFAT